MAEKKKGNQKTEKEEQAQEIAEDTKVEAEPQEPEQASEKEPSGDETVTIPLKDYADQLEELDDLRVKVDDFSAGWQRERADFSNYRKRVERDRDLNRINILVEILRTYLDVLDDLERALKNMPEEIASSSWSGGLELILQKLDKLLEKEGVEEIDAEGKAFNPDIHEAISVEENSDKESEEIIEVVQKGYKLGERVIRPARVRVAK